MTYCSLLWCVWPVRQHSLSMTSIKSLEIGIFTHWHICHFDAASFNKLGLDTITTGEEPNPSNQVEEVHSYRPIQSEPLCSERIVHIDIGTAHSVAVTGEIVAIHFIKLKKSSPFARLSSVYVRFFFFRKGSVFHLWQQPTRADWLQLSSEQPRSLPGARPPEHLDGCLWRRFHFSYRIRWVRPFNAN